MAQHAEVLAAKADDLSSSPRPHRMHKVSFDFLMSTCTYAHPNK